MKKIYLLLVFTIMSFNSSLAIEDSLMFKKIADEILLKGQCYDDLRALCKNIGNRLSGTPEAEQAVRWAKAKLQEIQPDKVYLQPVMVPQWHRGTESLGFKYYGENSFKNVPVLSLGNSEGTKGIPLTAEVIKIDNETALRNLTEEEASGKIVFFNHKFPQYHINTFDGYGETARYRSIAPNIASSKGAAGVIIRSVSTGLDDEPHTGTMRYGNKIKKIPAVAIGNTTADILEKNCDKGMVEAVLTSACTMKGEVLSHNVIAEIKGSEKPEEIILVGAHLDSWDVGDGAHDDGAGVVQCMELMRTFKSLGIQPKRTLRVVLFMNEENGLKGGKAYADSAFAHNENHILAIESDAGGFSPRALGVEMEKAKKEKIKSYASLFLPYGVYNFDIEEGGADISPLQNAGVPGMALLPDSQRYFDYHHTRADVFEAVNHRELKLGAIVMTQLVYLIDKYGL